MDRGNKLGLKVGDRIALTEAKNGAISDSSWNKHYSKLAFGTVIGYGKSQGYPIVLCDAAPTVGGTNLSSIKQCNDLYDAEHLGYINSTDLNRKCTFIYTKESFKKIDENNKIIEDEMTIINYGLKIGETVEISTNADRVSDSSWSSNGAVLDATVIGCNSNGTPLLAISSAANYGWPLKNILDDLTPRIPGTVAEPYLSLLRKDKDFADKKCIYILNETAFRRKKSKPEEKIKDDQLDDHQKLRYDLNLGDKVAIYVDKNRNVKYDLSDINQNSLRESYTEIIGTVVGFDKVNKYPLVVLHASQFGVIEGIHLPSASSNVIRKDLINSEKTGIYLVSDLMFKRFEKVSKKEKSMSSDKTTPAQKSFMDMIKSSANVAPYRVARMQAVTNGKVALLNVLKDKVDPNTFAIAEGFFNSDSGQAAILGMLGFGVPYVPKIGEDPRAQALAEEFRNEAVAKGFNEVANFAMQFLMPAMMSALAALPPVAEAVEAKAAKKEKKRIAEVVESQVQETDVEESEEEEMNDSESTSKKRAKA